MSEFHKEPTPALTAAVHEYIRTSHPNLSPGQLSKLTDVAMNDPLVSMARDFNIGLRLDTVESTLNSAIAANPRLTSRIPSTSELVEMETARNAKETGTLPDPATRIQLARKIAGLTDDQKLDLLPAGAKLDQVSIPVPAGTPSGKKLYSSMSAEELDVEMVERFGRGKHDMTIAERQNYHKALRGLDTHVETPVHDMVNSGVRTEEQLSPSERIRRYRESEKLKAR